MPTYAELVERDLVQKIREDLAGWSDGQILDADQDRVVEIMVNRYSYKPVEFVYGSERREPLVNGEPAVGVRIHFELKPSGGQSIPEFLELHASHHRGEPQLQIDQYSASFEVKPMGPAEQVQQMLDSIRSNVDGRNRDIDQGGPKLLVHAQNIFRARRAEAEAEQAAAQRAMDELNKLGIPELEAHDADQSNAASDAAVAASPIGGDAVEIHPTLGTTGASLSLTHAAAAPFVRTLDPRLERIRDLVEQILERAPDQFTGKVCGQILHELDLLAGFTATINESSGAAAVEVPQRLLTTATAFNWLGSALTAIGVSFVDDLAAELTEAGELVRSLLELAANPPV